MDRRLENVLNNWHTLSEPQKNMIAHMIAFDQPKRRWQFAPPLVRDRRRVILIGAPRRRRNDPITV